MNREIKICQNCKNQFTIEPEDLSFYKKINVPPPTFCPECRLLRRMMCRNVRNLYKLPCKAPGHSELVVSMYSPDKPLVVYDQEYWWSDNHDPLKYGKEYDFLVPFFTQFKELIYKTPLPNLSNINPVGSEYVNVSIDSKNCYLIFSATENENCFYSEGINACRDSADLLNCRKSERLYWSVDCRNCFNVAFGLKAINCSDSLFLYDCRNCTNCIGCWNLRNKQYCIFNEQYDKDSYFKKIESFNLGSYGGMSKLKEAFSENLSKALHRFANIVHSENVTGNNIEDCRNCSNVFDVVGTADSKYLWLVLENGGADNYDVSLATHPIRAYEGMGVGAGYDCKFAIATGDQSDTQYTFSCISGSSNLFGCVGLKNAKYCILNKQYSKEEYEKMVPKIIEHMNTMPYVDIKGRVYKYGEFFPPEIFPFSYNETIAQEHHPLSKAEALKKGYKWKDPEKKNYEITIMGNDLPDQTKEVDESILKQIIGCEHRGECDEQCTIAFKIIKPELQFYQSMSLPLPRLCPNCRHHQRLKERNPFELWRRQCLCDYKIYKNTTEHSHHPTGRCPNEFETSYSPERKEIVYCEACYNGEVV